MSNSKIAALSAEYTAYSLTELFDNARTWLAEAEADEAKVTELGWGTGFCDAVYAPALREIVSLLEQWQTAGKTNVASGLDLNSGIPPKPQARLVEAYRKGHLAPL